MSKLYLTTTTDLKMPMHSRAHKWVDATVGYDEEQIFDATGFDKPYIKRTVAEWIDRQKKDFNNVIGKPPIEEKPPENETAFEPEEPEDKPSTGAVSEPEKTSPVEEKTDEKVIAEAVLQVKQGNPDIDTKKLIKIVEILKNKGTILIQDGKLYYPGRDKLTYLFMGLTIIELIAIILLVL